MAIPGDAHVCDRVPTRTHPASQRSCGGDSAAARTVGCCEELLQRMKVHEGTHDEVDVARDHLELRGDAKRRGWVT